MSKPNFTILNVELPKDKYNLKAPYAMQPVGVTIHETDNNAPAINEIAYMQRNNNQVSFHYAVDEKEVVQGVPLNRNTWNAGDGGNGFGNRKTIAIEICRNYRTNDLTNYYKARANAEKLVGWLLHENGWNEKNIYTHNDHNGKNCPRVIRKEGYLNTFKKKAMAEKALYSKPAKPSKPTGELYRVRRVWSDARTQLGAYSNLDNAIKKAEANRGYTVFDEQGNDVYNVVEVKKTATEIAKDILNNPKHKYGNGDERKRILGKDWRAVQDEINRSLGITPTKPKPTPKPLKKGDKVKIANSATHYATGQKIPAVYKNKWYTIMQVSSNQMLIKELYSWVYVKDLIRG